jgi:RNA polymerase sigma-70 factor (ECF subfamily)
MITLSEQRIGELLDRMQAGDEHSLTELYRNFGRRVYAFALNGLRDAREAEQVVVDTMYEVWRQAHRFNRQCRFSTWVLGIARNKMLHALRARRPCHEDLDSVADALEAEDCDPFALVAQRETRKQMLRCLFQLPEEQRECVRMVFYHGMSLAEVAQVQGCPENTVKTRLFKARQRLKGILEAMREQERQRPAYRPTLPVAPASRPLAAQPEQRAATRRPLASSGVATLVRRIQPPVAPRPVRQPMPMPSAQQLAETLAAA